MKSPYFELPYPPYQLKVTSPNINIKTTIFLASFFLKSEIIKILKIFIVENYFIMESTYLSFIFVLFYLARFRYHTVLKGF